MTKELSSQTEEQSPAEAMPETGLVEKWEQAEDAFWEARSKLDGKARKILNNRGDVSVRLRELGLLCTIPNKERPELKILKGILIDKDGRELEVSAGDYGEYFSDLADPRRDVQITAHTIDLIAKEEGIYIDQLGRSSLKPTISRTQDGQRYRKKISTEEKYMHLRGDLDRDVLDAAEDGLALILDPETKLKSA